MTPLRGLVAVVLLLAVGAVTWAPTAVPAQPRALDDLMMDLNIAPLEPQMPPPLDVTTMDGGRMSLGDLKGRVVLAYFMATW